MDFIFQERRLDHAEGNCSKISPPLVAPDVHSSSSRQRVQCWTVCPTGPKSCFLILDPLTPVPWLWSQNLATYQSPHCLNVPFSATIRIMTSSWSITLDCWCHSSWSHYTHFLWIKDCLPISSGHPTATLARQLPNWPFWKVEIKSKHSAVLSSPKCKNWQCSLYTYWHPSSLIKVSSFTQVFLCKRLRVSLGLSLP